MNTDEMDADEYINAAMTQMFMQAHAQFGDAVKSFWFNDSGICPGCGRQAGIVKHKGKDALSINAFIHRKPGVLIGYFLCDRCQKEIFRAAKRNPGVQIARHDAIETNLVAAYQQHMSTLYS